MSNNWLQNKPLDDLWGISLSFKWVSSECFWPFFLLKKLVLSIKYELIFLDMNLAFVFEMYSVCCQCLSLCLKRAMHLTAYPHSTKTYYTDKKNNDKYCVAKNLSIHNISNCIFDDLFSRFFLNTLLKNFWIFMFAENLIHHIWLSVSQLKPRPVNLQTHWRWWK